MFLAVDAPSFLTVDNTTFPALDQGSCGGAGVMAPEVSVTFTASQPGTYRIDTQGSTVDTVLYVRAAPCGGVEVACNDDEPNNETWSVVEVGLSAGAEIIIFVDAFDEMAIGEVTLSITLL
jgi:hypothetical protein